jgi:purine-binding chemotaxis protein CheW
MSSNQILTFHLAGTEYGLGILCVQEIRGWSGVTRLPQAHPATLGVINLRGEIVPILDMRRRLGLPPMEVSPSTVVIVIRIATDARESAVGLVVDGISDVYDVEQEDLKPLPDIGSQQAQELIQGLTHATGKTIVLLNAAQLSLASADGRHQIQ